MIALITKVETITYRDIGQIVMQVQWVDHKGIAGCTSGDPRNAHMRELLRRAKREKAIITRR